MSFPSVVKRAETCVLPRTLVVAFLFVTLAGVVPGALAQQPKEFVKLAADFNPTPVNGNPASFMVYNDQLYFTATDGTHGIELWQTDGTNVTRLTDLSYGSANSFITSLAVYNN